MMAYRFLVLDRLLKPTGSLYLHCDPAASPYLKIMLDGVFGKELFKNEAIWKRTRGLNDKTLKNLSATREVILYFGKTICALSTSPK
jgi:site-specific DNA-methyltransferase (adenine-specific)